ncbi:CBS domain-containing protein [Marinobacter salinisoli]|uniref:CBS domain-containing protein n=1 Tax=Marinobacter salinisoli TaxID=2769486 RepID=A0ABX7MPG2_9GAMM|nr:CBS domain-containing protein [Marinobacter salinisoli]QSP94039.1 CBS domain-containing protein [Marinobacter salinisoli]
MSIFVSEPGRPGGLAVRPTQARKVTDVTQVASSSAVKTSDNTKLGSHQPVHRRALEEYGASDDGQSPLTRDYLPVRRLFSSPCYSVEAIATLEQALSVMDEHKVRQLAITNNGQIAGLLEKAQALESMYRSKNGKLQVVNVELPAYITVTPETDAHHLARLMLSHELTSALVIDQSGTLQGIVTNTDYLRFFAGLAKDDAMV